MSYDKKLQAVAGRVADGTPGASGAISGDATNVLRNTYLLLSMTLIFSSAMTAISMIVGAGPGVGLLCFLVALGLLWLVLPRTKESAAGLVTVFAVTGLLGFGIGPTLNYYLKAIPDGGTLIMTALGGTGLIFCSLSAYVLMTKKDFSFMGGFLMTGLLALIFSGLGGIVAALMGYDVSAFSMARAAVTMVVFSGLILYDTSRIIHRGETNYLVATIELYLDILNLFLALLRLLSRR